MSLVASAIASALIVQASPQSPTEEMIRLDDVVVSSRRDAEQIRSFLNDLALPERNLHTARFLSYVCVGVVNLQADPARLIADRVSQVAMDIGLEPAEPGCAPNILVVASDDGPAMARTLVQNKRLTFDPGGDGMIRTRSALEAFQTTDAAIRWWHVTMPMDPRTNSRAVTLPGMDDEKIPMVRGPNSRLRSELRYDINNVVVVLDLTKLEGLNFNQIADYVSMVSLSQVDARSDFSAYDSILAMNVENRQVQGLTDWDMSYLKALYEAELNHLHKSHQRGEIGSLMARNRPVDEPTPQE